MGREANPQWKVPAARPLTDDTTAGAATSHRPRRPAICSLTGARFVAAIMVVATHYVHFDRGPQWANKIIASGYLGVPFFLILSGFILTYNYVPRENRSEIGSWRIDVRAFWAARFARIYPAYLLALVIEAPFFILGTWLVLPQTGGTPWANILLIGFCTLTLTQAQVLVGPYHSNWNQPASTLSAEAFFYLLFPVSCHWTGRLSPRRGILILLGLFAWMVIVDRLLIPSLPQYGELFGIRGPLAWGRQPLRLWPLFLAGSAMCPLFIAATKQRWYTRWAGTVSTALVVSLLIATALAVPHRLGLYSDTVMAIILALLIFTMAFDRGPVCRLLGSPLALLLGEASYAVYILQEPLYCYLLRLYPRFLHRWDPMMTVFQPTVVFVIIIVSLLTNVYFERPARQLLRNWLTRRRGEDDPRRNTNKNKKRFRQE